MLALLARMAGCKTDFLCTLLLPSFLTFLLTYLLVSNGLHCTYYIVGRFAGKIFFILLFVSDIKGLRLTLGILHIFVIAGKDHLLFQVESRKQYVHMVEDYCNNSIIKITS